MLKPEQVAELKNLVTEGKRLLEAGDTQAAAEIQQRIEALKAEWRSRPS